MALDLKGRVVGRGVIPRRDTVPIYGDAETPSHSEAQRRVNRATKAWDQGLLTSFRLA